MDRRREAQQRAQRFVAVSLGVMGLYQAFEATRDELMQPIYATTAAISLLVALAVGFFPLTLRPPRGVEPAADEMEERMAALHVGRRRRILAIVSIGTAATALSVAYSWAWEGRVVVDVLGLAWLLGDTLPLAMVAAFGMTAIATFARWVELGRCEHARAASRRPAR